MSRELLDLYRHNRWANGKVFELVVRLDDELVDAEAPGTRDTVRGTLTHLTRVEDVYLAMIERRPRESLGTAEEYEAHDLKWFNARVQEIDAAYVRLLESTSADQLQHDLGMPWFDFAISAREGLLQVLTHSAQHRSQVLSWLSARGVATPDLDYVLLLGEERAPQRQVRCS
jgi:uncharacterized damage-inducible protein DinB